MAPKKIPPEQWAEARAMLEQGKTQAEVAKHLGVSQPRVSHKLGQRKPKPAEQETV